MNCWLPTKKPNQVYSFIYLILHRNSFVSFTNQFYRKYSNCTISESLNSQYFLPSQLNYNFPPFALAWLFLLGLNHQCRCKVSFIVAYLKFLVSAATSSNSKPSSTRSVHNSQIWFAHSSRRRISLNNSSSLSRRFTINSRFPFNV